MTDKVPEGRTYILPPLGKMTAYVLSYIENTLFICIDNDTVKEIKLKGILQKKNRQSTLYVNSTSTTFFTDYINEYDKNKEKYQ